MASLGKHPLAIAAHRELAACYFDRSELSFVPENIATEPPWVEQVLQFRRDGKLDPDLRTLSEHVSEIQQRLMKDGQSNPSIRRRIADLLQSWPATLSKATDRAIVQLWLGNSKDAIAIIDSSLTANNQSEALIAAATQFQDSESKDARIAAIGWWDRLAAGSETGSPAWHRGKMAAIDLLYQNGKKAEASRRANYILLTTPNLTKEQKSKYKSYQP